MLHYSNYFKIAHGNFGDDLNPWLWSRLAPEVCDDKDPTLFLGIGTILSRQVPKSPVKVVFGSGCGSNRPPKELDGKWFFYAVRGPLTAAKLKLDAALAIGDPAILVRGVGVAAARKIFPVSFMPHHQSMREAPWERLCERAGFHCINPCGTVDQVLREIQQTDVLLTEAMHGAIVADALRVPWIPIRIYSRFMEFKWKDWTQAAQVPLRIADVPPVFSRNLISPKGLLHASKKTLALAGIGKEKWKRLPIRSSSEGEISDSLCALEKALKGGTPCLSPEEVIRQAEARLLEKLAQLREDWKAGLFAQCAPKAEPPAVVKR